MPRPSRIRFLALGLPLVTIFLAGCAVPLGPGFRHLTREIAISQVPAPAGSQSQAVLHVELSDNLENIGNRDLAYLDLVVPAPSACDPAELQRRSFGKPAWQPNQLHAETFGYDLAFRRLGNCGISAATPEGVYLTDPYAFPSWLPPLGPFSKGDSRALQERVRITLPADYRVLAPGREQRSIRQGVGVLHEFRVPSDDFPFYLVAGRYQEQRVKTQHQTLIFWTLEPLNEQTAGKAAERLATTATVYQNFFGPLPKKEAKTPWPIRIVETSADLAPRWPPFQSPSSPESSLIDDRSSSGWAVSFPEGVLLDRRAVAQGLATDAVLRIAEYQLAGTWFDWSVRPAAGSQLLQGRTMGRFGIVLAAEARGGDAARRSEIARLIEAYDRDARVEIDPGSADGHGVPLNPLQRAAWQADRGALFCVALEDMAGKERLQRALQRVLQGLAGQEVEDADLRSALEGETGRDFADVFRQWLGHPGIPSDFRATYAPAR